MSAPLVALVRGLGPMVIGTYRGHLAAYDGVSDRVWQGITREDLEGLVSLDPAACAWGLGIHWEEDEMRVANPRLLPVPQAEAEEYGHLFRTGVPVTFWAAHNTQPSARFGTTMGQHLEPRGRFVLSVAEDAPAVRGWEYTSVSLRSPLVMPLHLHRGREANLYDEGGWKAQLSRAYGGKTGLALTRALLAEGFDAVVTVDRSETSEIVLLQDRRLSGRRVNPLSTELGPRGGRFDPFPAGVVSGFPMAEAFLRLHRARPPEPAVVILSAAFSFATVQTSIARAEKGYGCFARLFAARRSLPDREAIRACFLEAGTGFENKRADQIVGLGEFGENVIGAMKRGLQDRALRRHLATETTLPDGLSLTKLSFTLALLGQDVVCLDARLLGKLFPDKAERHAFELATRKGPRGLLDKAVRAYEAAEDAFLEGNPYYRPGDSLGRARAQWMSWESVGHRTKQGWVVTPATHETWFTAIAEHTGPVAAVPRAENPVGQDALERLAAAYLDGKDLAHSGEVQAMAREQTRRIEQEFERLQRRIDVRFVAFDPYTSFEQLRDDVLSNRRMLVYTGASETPLWSPEVNWKARAVHDYDHIRVGADFSVEGELAAYRYTAARAPALAPLYLSEIALQAAASAVRGSFPEGTQKVVLVDEPTARLALENPLPLESDAREVLDLVALLDWMSEREVMAHLAAAGATQEEAVKLVYAAELVRKAEGS